MICYTAFPFHRVIFERSNTPIIRTRRTRNIWVVSSILRITLDGTHRDDSLLKMLYLAMMDITKKWTGRRQDWSLIYTQIAICFAERMPV